MAHEPPEKRDPRSILIQEDTIGWVPAPCPQDITLINIVRPFFYHGPWSIPLGTVPIVNQDKQDVGALVTLHRYLRSVMSLRRLWTFLNI